MEFIMTYGNSDDEDDMEADIAANTSSNSNAVQKEKKNTRKRKSNEKKWACKKRKEARNKGLEYISSRKKVIPAKFVKKSKDCVNKCIYKCSQKITDDEKFDIFTDYYNLTLDEKRMFLISNTSCELPKRRRNGKTDENSKKKVCYHYFFTVKSEQIRVCKTFFCDTLAISQKPIYNVHKLSNSNSKTTISCKQGKHTKRVTHEDDILLIKEHINSFPRISSHYCRKNTTREYLERNLNISKMFSLYKDWIIIKNRTAVKKEIYRQVFCNDFNLYFQRPKKDRCDLCEELKVKNKESETLLPDFLRKINTHKLEKEAARKNRNKDRKENIPVLCFDMENVLTCPKAEVSNFFYKSKFATYNLTAHLSSNKKVYCAIWTEATAGRGGNDIASAMFAILKQVLNENPQFSSIILWSDSCVPQNRNSFMSFAMRCILGNYPNLREIFMKFSTPGHSCIQEIDNVHSCIDRVLKKSEYYSPINVIRLIQQVNLVKPYCIIQMSKNDFLDFQKAGSGLKYSLVPFSKVTELKFTQSVFEVSYKQSHTEETYKKINLKPQRTRRQNNGNICGTPKIMKKPVVGKTKIDTIKSMYRWMPRADVEYYETVFNE